MSKDTIKPVKEEPTSTAHPEIGDVLTLVKEEDPEKLVFLPTVVESLKKQHPTILSLTSHPGKALSYSKTSNVPSSEPNFYVFVPCLVAADSDTLRWKYEEDTYLTTILREDDDEDHDYVLHIDQRKLEERRPMWLLREGNEKKTRQKGAGRAFKINDNGSISPRDDPALFLGRRGETVKDERLLVAIGLGYNTAEIQALLAQDDIDVDATALSSCALNAACQKRNYELTEFLLKDCHANPNVKFDKHLATPLHWAAISGLEKFVKLFLKYGPDRNSLNLYGSSPVSLAALFGKLNAMKSLLDDPETDIYAGNPAVSHSIVNNHLDCLKMLLDYGASLDMLYEEKYPIQQACQKGIANGLLLVEILIKERGDFSTRMITEMKDKEINGSRIEVLIRAYANLSIKELSLCGARAYLKDNDEFSAFLECSILASSVQKLYYKIRRSDSAAADDYLKLFTKLQLLSASIINEYFKDERDNDKLGRMRIIEPKEKVLQRYLELKSSKKAITFAHNTRSRILFSQPVLFQYFTRLWYGELLHEVIVVHDTNSYILFLWQVFAIAVITIIQVPLLLFLGYLPQKLVKVLENIEVPIFAKALQIKTNKPFIILEPFVLFIVQCCTDLVLAIIFSTLDANQLITSIRSVEMQLLTFTLISALVMETREMCTMKNITNYFMVDPFNTLDLPALVMATLTLLLPLIFEDYITTSALKVLLSFATALLWLRMLRSLTLSTHTGPLTFMFFRMLGRMVEWLFLLVFVVIAFATALPHLDLTDENECSNIKSFAPLEFFEDAIAADNNLFYCKEGDNNEAHGVSATVLIYLFVLIANIMLINMLIAMMAESFSSIWDAQESNSIFQRATHCLEMREKRYVPVQCVYFPYGIFELGTYFAKRFMYYLSRSDRNENSIKHENVESIAEPNEIDSYDSEEEFKLSTNNTSLYHDEAPKEDHGQLSQIKKKGTIITEAENLTQKIEKYSHDPDEENKLSAIFSDYISMRQDEASEEDHWRLTQARKITTMTKEVDNLKQKVEQKMDENQKTLEQKMEETQQTLEQKMEKNQENLEKNQENLEQKVDDLTIMLKHFLDQQDNQQ